MAKNLPQWIIVHHSVTPPEVKNDTSEASFNANHKARGFPKSKAGWHIGYHWVIYDSGEKRQYREDDEVGAHCKEQMMNFKSIGICLEGNFDVQEPPKTQNKALLALITEYQEKYHFSDEKVVPHRYFATGTLPNDTKWLTFMGKKPYKTCWGKLLPNDIISYLKNSMIEFQIPITENWRIKAREFAKQKELLKDIDSFVTGSFDAEKILVLVINSNPGLKAEWSIFLQNNI